MLYLYVQIIVLKFQDLYQVYVIHLQDFHDNQAILLIIGKTKYCKIVFVKKKNKKMFT
jgi:hypothetical protein